MSFYVVLAISTTYRSSMRTVRSACVGTLLAAVLSTGSALAAEYEQRAVLPGQEPTRSETDAAAAERVGGHAPAAPAPAAPAPPAPSESGGEEPAAPKSVEYKPFCSSGQCNGHPDDELNSCNEPVKPGSKPHNEYSDLTLLTLGAGVSLGYFGHRWQAGYFGGGLSSIDASFVPFVNRKLVWLGFWGAFSRDSGLERSRLGLGLEAGLGGWGLSAGPLLKVKGEGDGKVGLETRLSFSAPAAYNRPKYERACCPVGSDLRSCACAHVVKMLIVEPDVRMEYWPTGPGPDVRVFAGLTGKFGLAF
jgi:hypothetical protein